MRYLPLHILHMSSVLILYMVHIASQPVLVSSVMLLIIFD
jgi:hypothetical protein